MIVQTKVERRENDALQGCHWTISLLKHWLLGTHAGAMKSKHLQAYLDEFAFRHNRRKTNGVGRIDARVIEQLVALQPLPMRKITDETRRCRWFGSGQLRKQQLELRDRHGSSLLRNFNKLMVNLKIVGHEVP